MKRLLALLIAIWLTAVWAAPLAAEDLPDTGLITCYSNLGVLTPCPTEGQPFYGQDAQYVGAQPDPRFWDNGDGTVSDLVTGLRWDKSDDGATRNWQEAFDYCIDRNAKLPTLFQLETIVDYKRYGPATDPELTTQATGTYWSKTSITSTFPGLPDSAWLIHFYKGRSERRDKENYERHYVRCVRGEWDIGLGPYSGWNTVTDSTTGLIWQKDRGSFNTWQEALAHCEALGQDGRSWRLPNIRELRSIIHPAAYPAIDTDFFETEHEAYWSSTTAADSASSAWSVEFEQGRAWTTEGSKSNYHYVRCVSGGHFVQYRLTVSAEIKDVTVTSVPPGIDCVEGFTDCSEYFNKGTEVTLTMSDETIPEVDCYFIGCDSTGQRTECTVTMNEARAVLVECRLAQHKTLPGTFYLLLGGD